MVIPEAHGLALLPYAAVMVAAIVEGEVAYISAAALVAEGRLHPAGVLVFGAIGAAIGDQAYFYLFRGRVTRWLARFPAIEQKAMPLVARVRRHHKLMVFLIRFAPGLRIALAAACASAEVPAVTFSLLNLLSAFLWAAGLLVLVGWLGPAYLARYGLAGWKAALVVGVAVFGLLKFLGAYERRALERPDSS